MFGAHGTLVSSILLSKDIFKRIEGLPWCRNMLVAHALLARSPTLFICLLNLFVDVSLFLVFAPLVWRPGSLRVAVGLAGRLEGRRCIGRSRCWCSLVSPVCVRRAARVWPLLAGTDGRQFDEAQWAIRLAPLFLVVWLSAWLGSLTSCSGVERQRQRRSAQHDDGMRWQLQRVGISSTHTAHSHSQCNAVTTRWALNSLHSHHSHAPIVASLTRSLTQPTPNTHSADCRSLAHSRCQSTSLGVVLVRGIVHHLSVSDPSVAVARPLQPSWRTILSSFRTTWTSLTMSTRTPIWRWSRSGTPRCATTRIICTWPVRETRESWTLQRLVSEALHSRIPCNRHCRRQERRP